MKGGLHSPNFASTAKSFVTSLLLLYRSDIIIKCVHMHPRHVRRVTTSLSRHVETCMNSHVRRGRVICSRLTSPLSVTPVAEAVILLSNSSRYSLSGTSVQPLLRQIRSRVLPVVFTDTCYSGNFYCSMVQVATVSCIMKILEVKTESCWMLNM